MQPKNQRRNDGKEYLMVPIPAELLDKFQQWIQTQS
jgi:hypothetical protein